MGVNYELPDSDVCEMALLRPASPTPHHILPLSTLDNMRFHRNYVKFVFLYRESPDVEAMKSSLSAVLVPYYPLAGRLKARVPEDDDGEQVVECTGDGVLFANAFMDTTVEALADVESVLFSKWKKFIPCQELEKPFLTNPLVLIQVTRLRCGGMILCLAGNHCLADGIGFFQFLNAWAQLHRHPDSPLPVSPCWGRESVIPNKGPSIHIPQDLQGPEPNPFTDEPLVPVIVTFGAEMIQQLKNQCLTKNRPTSFDVLTAHVWRCFVRAMFDGTGPPKYASTWVGFVANIRSYMEPPLPIGYYGNATVTGVAQCNLRSMVESEDVCLGVQALQANKSMALSHGYVQMFMHVADRLNNSPSVEPNLMVSQWSKLGFESVDFGSGRPVRIGGHASARVPLCLFLPVMDDAEAIKACVTVPRSRACTLGRYLGDLVKDPKDQTQC